jgi:hypothetical protein
MADDNETIRTVRESFMRALVKTLNAVEKNATKGNKTDAEATLQYAQAAQALISSDLGREIVVGKQGLP